jgi:hypothetical protein
MVHTGAVGLTLNAASMVGFLLIGVFVVRLFGGALGVFFAFFAMSCVGAGLINRAPTLPARRFVTLVSVLFSGWVGFVLWRRRGRRGGGPAGRHGGTVAGTAGAGPYGMRAAWVI